MQGDNSFFDTEWIHQEFIGFNPTAKNGENALQRPSNLDEQIDIARVLAKDKSQTRIDFYNVSNKLYFGEITLYPMSGFGRIRPEKYDKILGQILILLHNSVN